MPEPVRELHQNCYPRLRPRRLEYYVAWPGSEAAAILSGSGLAGKQNTASSICSLAASSEIRWMIGIGLLAVFAVVRQAMVRFAWKQSVGAYQVRPSAAVLR